jgi:hypothetical protein
MKIAVAEAVTKTMISDHLLAFFRRKSVPLLVKEVLMDSFIPPERPAASPARAKQDTAQNKQTQSLPKMNRKNSKNLGNQCVPQQLYSQAKHGDSRRPQQQMPCQMQILFHNFSFLNELNKIIFD